jgi:hypothetical protein
VPERDDDAAYEHAAVLTQEPVGDDAAEDRQAPCAGGVGAVDGRGVRIGEAQPARGHWRDHVEDEECAHAVVAEALPHLRKEERREATRVAKEAGIGRRRQGGLLHVGKDNVEQ